MRDLARFCCQNPDCTFYGRRDAGNLSVCGRYGREKQFRQLYCNACRARFSERKGTPLYRCHLPEVTAVSVLEHLAEGDGIRPTGRLVGVHRDTVIRLARAAGGHAHDTHDELVAFSPLGRARFSSTRSGPSSIRSRRTATLPIPPMITRGTGGTTSLMIPSIG